MASWACPVHLLWRAYPSQGWHDAVMPNVTLTVPDYDPARGVVIYPEQEGGFVLVSSAESGIEILGDRAGLRDLARWCLALAAQEAPDGVHVHLDPGSIPLMSSAMPLMIGRRDELTE